MSNYLIHTESIGKGMFGTVYKACLRTDQSQIYACKVQKRNEMSKRLRDNLENEIKILNEIRHPNVVRLVDFQRTTNNYYLFFEYCNGTDLENLKKLRGKFTEPEARFIMR